MEEDDEQRLAHLEWQELLSDKPFPLAINIISLCRWISRLLIDNSAVGLKTIADVGKKLIPVVDQSSRIRFFFGLHIRMPIMSPVEA